MSVSKTMHTLRQWIEDNVCSQIKLKVEKSPMTDKYDYELVHPKAWLMFEPPDDARKAPSLIPKNPSILVQLVDATDDPIHNEQRMNIRLHLVLWDPGTHGKDVFLRAEDGRYVRGDSESFTPSMAGMEDAFNLLDTTLDALKQTVDLPGFSVRQQDGITFGHYQSADGIPNYYPYYLMWIDFSISVPQAPTRHNTIDGLL